MSQSNPSITTCEDCDAAPITEWPGRRLCALHVPKLMTKAQVLQSEARYAMLPDSMFCGDMWKGV